MDSRLDILLIGATGYTGKNVALNLGLLCKRPEFSFIRWGIAGRSRQKMKELLTELQNLGVDVAQIPAIECDILKGVSLADMTSMAKVIMNATGPNVILSAPIVSACIQTGTHYIDISAELYHMLSIYRDYNTAAEQSNVLVIPGCGFACVPVTAGLMYLEKEFKGNLNSVVCYTVIDVPLRANFLFPGYNNSLIHYGTWESLVFELQNYKKYSKLKSITFPDIPPVPEELKKPFFHFQNGRLWYPYPGPDHDLVEQAQIHKRADNKPSYDFKIYTTMPLFIHFVVVTPIFFLYYILCKMACFSKLLFKFPRVFSFGLASHKGPSDKMRLDTKYSFTMTGKGKSGEGQASLENDVSLTIKVSGSDPGYYTTAIVFICSAIDILTDRSNMPTGGVISPLAAFSNTHLVELLQKNDMKIETIRN
ncbi:saccharopine dehydrogenase-like oxidoreductase [Pectinophora gossypiella]|uniref:saccharopine dehydrogenase-like oxidoreductase n=1 Tax=Pectinophora gossypiella TaxID=13191 RepID=UPI00214F57D2|nr:saccharopine dehydrogenase-like oxidoreductase [Pectinophora gossypiella]XP_049871022.1 saccharopine dehydrogenase-like oxidoreductase [Pectinophora gossypiella]